jgi:hypothetical protein
MKNQVFNILILGASYGSLLATKLIFAGHNAKLICTREEAELINSQGTIVRIPINKNGESIEINSASAKGSLSAEIPQNANPKQYDLVILAMQEPQYGLPQIRELLSKIGKSKIPCVSIMNMPPPPFLTRLKSIDMASIEDCYTDVSVWHHLSKDLMTNCSPDPQAFRPEGELANVLQVRLPTNFKCATFNDESANVILRSIEKDIDSTKIVLSDGSHSNVPVKLRVFDSVFIPLAKWPMLITGNYRCILDTNVRSIKDAVHEDLTVSEELYSWVRELCGRLGSTDLDMVPFQKYADATLSLTAPSSPARALLGGALTVERADRLIQKIAADHGQRHPILDMIVERVDHWLAKNYRKLN